MREASTYLRFISRIRRLRMVARPTKNIPVTGEGCTGFITEVFRDARGRKDDVSKRVRHAITLGVSGLGGQTMEFLSGLNDQAKGLEIISVAWSE